MRLPGLKRRKAARPDSQGDMALVDHLSELRMRLIKCVLAVVAGATLVLIFNKPIFGFLARPYCTIAPAGLPTQSGEPSDCVFLVTGPLDTFNVLLSLAGWGGLVLALPVILYQMARFVLPGLYPNEKRAVLPFLAVSLVLLLLGMATAYMFLPRSLEVLSNLGDADRFQAFYNPREYLAFFVKMILAFGIAFEFPLILVFLQMTGLVQTQTLRRQRRLAIVFVVIVAAVITPTGDPFTLAVVAVPMYLFYEASLIIGGWLTRRQAEVL